MIDLQHYDMLIQKQAHSYYVSQIILKYEALKPSD